MNPRLELIDKLGAKCVSCGNEDIHTLIIEHKLGNGYMEKDWFKRNKFDMFETYLKDFELEKQFIQVFCYNCNIKKKLTLKEFRGRQTFDDVPLFNKPFLDIDPEELIDFLDKNPIFMQSALRQVRMIQKLAHEAFESRKESWEQEL